MRCDWTLGACTVVLVRMRIPGAMTGRQPNNPLHGVTLEMMLRQMVDRFGWEGLARDIPINCFLVDPSMTSALKYLRKAPRARKKVEEIYVRFAVDRLD